MDVRFHDIVGLSCDNGVGAGACRGVESKVNN